MGVPIYSTDLWIKRFFFVFILLLLSACNGNYQKIPGNDVFSLKFEPDLKVFDSGTFRFGNGHTFQLGGSWGHYNEFRLLHLKFRMKDGREFEQALNIPALVKKMDENYKVFDVRKTKWGGAAKVLTRITDNELLVLYSVRERIQNPPYYTSKTHEYPLLSISLINQ